MKDLVLIYRSEAVIWSVDRGVIAPGPKRHSAMARCIVPILDLVFLKENMAIVLKQIEDLATFDVPVDKVLQIIMCILTCSSKKAVACIRIEQGV